jgi:hypothetical protein
LGIHLKLVNFNALFNNTSTEPIIVNDLSSSTEEDRNHINRLISTKYEDTDLFSNEPSCECGITKSGYNLGVICPNCKTPVREIFDQQLKPLVWMRSPHGVSSLINPIVWTMLTKKFVKGGFSFIDWLCNTDYQPAVTRPPEIQELIGLGIQRGYNNFVANFDAYIDMLYSLKHFKEKKDKEDTLKQLLTEQRDCVFSSFLPLPNKSLMIIEDTKVGVYVDPIIVGAIDAIRTISSIDAPLSNYTIRQKENRTAKTIAMLSDFYYKVYHDILAGKNGMFRKHVFGSRNHFSCRAVISSNTKAHNYDEIHIAWGHGCTMLKIHIVNKLLRLGWSPNEANSFVQDCTSRYHPLMEQIFNELIDESPDKGLYCFFLRNPSLSRSSVQRMKITKIKTDINDPTISLSIIAVAGYNALNIITVNYYM